MKITIDPESLTFGDLEDFERETGEVLLKALDALTKNQASAKALIGLVWVCQRQIDPGFSMDDARKVKLSDIEVESAGADPTPGDD